MSEFYELPDGWEWKILSDCVSEPKKDIVDGPFGSNLKATEYINSGIPIIRLQNIQRFKFLDKDIKFVSKKKEAQLKRHTFKSGDIVITKLGEPLGKSCVVPEYLKKGIIVADVIRVRVNEEKTNKSYVEYVLNSQVSINQFTDNSKGATRKRVKLTMVRALSIPLPPLQEQEKIVSKLDTLFEKIDKSIAMHQKNMDEADVFMGSVLNDVFGELEEKYETIDFNSVCNKITDGSHNPPKGIESSNYLMLSSKNIHNNSIHFENPRYLKEEDFIRENRRTDVTIGDVLLTIVGTIGRTAVVNIDKKFTLQRSVAVLKPKKYLLDSYFLMYSLQKNLSVLTSGAKGAAQKGIYLKSIKELTIINLPLNLQQKIVTYLDEISQKIEKIKQVQKEKMQSLVALKASILDQAFRGEL